MSFSRAFQSYHSHLDPIWPDGTFKQKGKHLQLMIWQIFLLFPQPNIFTFYARSQPVFFAASILTVYLDWEVKENVAKLFR